jgi:hypothetical protein
LQAGLSDSDATHGNDDAVRWQAVSCRKCFLVKVDHLIDLGGGALTNVQSSVIAA